MNALGALTFLAREAVAAVGHMIAGRAFEAYSDDADILAGADGRRAVLGPYGYGEFFTSTDPVSVRSAWDVETAEGLAYAAEREARISALVLITERHAIATPPMIDDGHVCSCGRPFTGLDAWAEHVAELIDDAITTMIFPAVAEQPAAAGTGGLPPTTPHGRREAGRPTNPTK
jgi:hypothetical protein